MSALSENLLKNPTNSCILEIYGFFKKNRNASTHTGRGKNKKAEVSLDFPRSVA